MCTVTYYCISILVTAISGAGCTVLRVRYTKRTLTTHVTALALGLRFSRVKFNVYG